MSQLKKTLVVVATILTGALVSQDVSGKDKELHHAIMKKEADSAEEKILAALDKPAYTRAHLMHLANHWNEVA